MGNIQQVARVGIESLELRFLLSYPPAVNDLFANATILEGTQASGSASWDGASTEPGDPQQPLGLVQPTTLWWRWTAPQDGLFAIDMAGTASSISVYVGDTLESLSPVPEVEAGKWLASAGTTYQIEATYLHYPNPSVYPTYSSSDGGVWVHLSQTDAERPSVASSVRTGATRDPYAFSPDFFTEFYSPADGRPLTKIVLSRPARQVQELYYKGERVTPGTEISIDEISDLVFYPAQSGTSSASFPWWGGDSLRWSGAAQATIWFAFETSPANDDWADRQQISGPEVKMDVNTAGATTEHGETNVHANGTVWYEWTAPYSGVLRNYGVRCTFYEGDFPFASNGMETGQVEAGKTYSIAVAAPPGNHTIHFAVAARLEFAGTGNDDVVRFTSDAGTLKIQINDAFSEYPMILVSSIVLRTGQGNDSVLVDISPVSPTLSIQVYCGAGDDTIISGATADALRGGLGNDSIRGGAGDDQIYGGAGDDLLFGDAGRDVVLGKGDSDTLFGGADPDTINGGEGSDLLRGGLGYDKIEGEAGNDTIYGGRDNDRVNAGEGDDQLFGLDGHDTLFGGLGLDTIDGGLGNDVLCGTALSLLVASPGEDEVSRNENGVL